MTRGIVEAPRQGQEVSAQLKERGNIGRVSIKSSSEGTIEELGELKERMGIPTQIEGTKQIARETMEQPEPYQVKVVGIGQTTTSNTRPKHFYQSNLHSFMSSNNSFTRFIVPLAYLSPSYSPYDITHLYLGYLWISTQD